MNLKRKHLFEPSPQLSQQTSSSPLTSSQNDVNNVPVESTSDTSKQRVRRNSCASTDSAYSFDSISSAPCAIDTSTSPFADTAPLKTTPQQQQQQQIVSKTFADKSTSIEPELLGVCKRGTPILLEGIVWNETSKGVLVLNVNWKGRTFIGALMDSSRTGDWSAPRFNQNTCLATSHRHTSRDHIEFAEYDFLVSQDPSIRTLRNGKRRFLKTQAAAGDAKTEKVLPPAKKSKKTKPKQKQIVKAGRGSASKSTKKATK